MTLGELLLRTGTLLGEDLTTEGSHGDIFSHPVASIAYDSKRVSPGAVFVGLRGQQFDGTTFAGEAEQQGAVCIVSTSPATPGIHLPWVRVRDARQALAALSPEFDRMYAEVGRPSIPPERLLKASLLISLYSVRSERAFCEELDYPPAADCSAGSWT